MAIQPVYLVAAKNLGPFLKALGHAQAPEKVGLKFIEDLGFTSTNDRLFIPLLAIFQARGLSAAHEHELLHANDPVTPGPLARFVQKLSELQKAQRERPEQHPMLRIAIVTARNAPSHERVVKTLRQWEISVDKAFFLGGINKEPFLSQFRPHMFFDDQLRNLKVAASSVPCAHIPFATKSLLRILLDELKASPNIRPRQADRVSEATEPNSAGSVAR